MKTTGILLLAIISIVAITTFGSCDTIFGDSHKDGDSTLISAWVEVGGTNSSLFDGDVIMSVKANANGNVYAIGETSNNLYKWDNHISKWTTLSAKDNALFNVGIRFPLAIDNEENVYVSALNQLPMINATFHIGRWDISSTKWAELGSSNQPSLDDLRCLETDQWGNVYAAGIVIYAGGGIDAGNNVYKWNKGSDTWSKLVGSPANSVFCMYVDVPGNVYVAGEIGNENFSPYVSVWNGTQWSEVGGKNSANFGTGQIYSIAVDKLGNVYAAGYFIYGTAMNNIAKWDHTSNTWSFMPTVNMSTSITSIVTDNDGNLYAAGEFRNQNNNYYVAKWDGNGWKDYGNLNANGSIKTLFIDVAGNLYAAGTFTNAKHKPIVAFCKYGQTEK